MLYRKIFRLFLLVKITVLKFIGKSVSLAPCSTGTTTPLLLANKEKFSFQSVTRHPLLDTTYGLRAIYNGRSVQGGPFLQGCSYEVKVNF